MKTGYKVCDAMTKAPITVSPSASIQLCAQIMEVNNVGSLLVKEGSSLLGIFTDEDIVRKIIAKGIDPKKESVEKHMVKKLITISPEKDIFDALMLMTDEDIRQLPVMANNKMLGLLTLKDVLKIEPELFDLIVDKIKLKEEDQKPVNEGLCQTCGDYSPRLLSRKEALLCKECAK